MAVDPSIPEALTAGIVPVQQVLSTVGALDNAPTTVLQTVYAAVQNYLSAFIAAIAAYDADIDTTSVGSVVAGLPAPQLATALLNQADDVSQEATIVVAQAYATRIGFNVNNQVE